MSGIVRDWRVELVEAYSDCFRPVGDPPAAQSSPSVDVGWRDLLVRARIRATVEADGGTFHATLIKEKYGTLRFYWDGTLSPDADTKIEEAIDLAEARSACTCEVCGEPGRLHARLGLAGDALRGVRRGAASRRESPRLREHFVVERIVGDRREVRCRRYDRATESFIDIDPASVGIQED